jgi:uncharacterized iron-regulated protein
MRTSQRSFAITVAAAVFGGMGVAGAAVVAQPASGAPEQGACVRQAAQVARAAKAHSDTRAQQVRLTRAQHRLEQCQADQTPTVDPTRPESPVV